MPIEINDIVSKRNESHLNKASETDVSSIWKKEITFQKPLPDKAKERFYTELAILLNAGLDLKASLDIVCSEEKNKKTKKIYVEISEMLLHGESLSGCVKEKKEFTSYEYFSIKVGEESGKMIRILEELSLYYQKKLKQQKQIISAISYPVLIFITAFGAVFFMLNFIVPLFADAFKRFNSELPALTKGVVYLSDIFRDYWYFIPIVLILLYLLNRFLKSKEWYKSNVSKIILKMPIVGKLVQKVYLASFCQSMALLTSAKTPLIQALELVSQMLSFYPLQKSLVIVQDRIYHGKLLHEAMADFSFFDSRMISLIKVGEETNQLETIFKRLYDQYTQETEHQTSIMSSMLEPFLIIVIGGMVAIILIAMYLPMFKLGGSIIGV